jgi:glutathione peroxidase
MTASTLSLRDVPLTAIDGTPTSLAALGDGATLLVNVASRCGLTPQYVGLERIAERYAARGLTVVGVPCNQFGEQEPGSAEEITAFCSSTYGVTFPLLEKTDVNGPDRHPLFDTLTEVAGADGYTGDVRWNFEKWVIDADGTVVARFKPKTDPEAPEVLAALDAVLA